jgi:hypothetical protein
LKSLIDQGLTATATLWPSIRTCYGWLHRAATILKAEGIPGAKVRRHLAGLVAAMVRYRSRAGELSAAVDHFHKVTRSYWPALFACYDTPDLPRTNNDLEQLFGSHRYHERRATGRKVASPALVLRGSARLIAAVATRQRTFTAMDLAQADARSWQRLRTTLEERRHRRTQRGRFRRNPKAYLQRLEAELTQLALPA